MSWIARFYGSSGSYLNSEKKWECISHAYIKRQPEQHYRLKSAWPGDGWVQKNYSIKTIFALFSTSTVSLEA